MAYTYKGSVASFAIQGNGAITQPIFSLDNLFASRVNVVVKRLTTQNDSLGLLTSVMPLVKTTRTTSPASGGVILPHAPYDTLLTSDANVVMRSPLGLSHALTVHSGNVLWQQYTNRLHTGVGQQTSWDNNSLPMLVQRSDKSFTIAPGSGLEVSVIGLSTLSNAALTSNWMVQCVWEEYAIGTFPISGNVSLSGSPVTGAKVMVMEATDKDMANARLVEVVTTNALGNWSSAIKSGCVGAAFVQYRNGGTYYTASGNPFLEPS